MYLGSWILWQVWNPEGPLLQTVKGVLFGGSPYGIEMDFSFPLLPWFGIYLAGSAVGGWLQRVGPAGMWRVSRRLLLFAGAMFAAVFVVKAGFMLRTYMGGEPLDLVWYRYINPAQKHPPGPFYLLLFTGTAFLLLGFFFSQPQRSWVKSCRRWLEPIGKNALPIFIFQFFLYWTLFYLLVVNVPTLPLWGALGLLLLSLIGVVVGAGLCQRYKVAQFLTMGVPIPAFPQLKSDGAVRRSAA